MARAARVRDTFSLYFSLFLFISLCIVLVAMSVEQTEKYRSWGSARF
jgi:hypothetical protein